MWPLGQQNQHSLGAREKCKFLGPTPDGLNQNLFRNKVPRVSWGCEKNHLGPSLEIPHNTGSRWVLGVCVGHAFRGSFPGVEVRIPCSNPVAPGPSRPLGLPGKLSKNTEARNAGRTIPLHWVKGGPRNFPGDFHLKLLFTASVSNSGSQKVAHRPVVQT